MFMHVKLLLAIGVLVFSTNAIAMTISGEQTKSDADATKVNAPANPSMSESTLHGNFTSLTPERVLKTSVGEFQLGANAHVIDRRLDPEAPTKVTIRFRNNRAFEVTIYQ